MKTKPDILIFDVPDRRSLPVTGSLGKRYSFHFLIPIRKGFWFQPLVELVIRVFKPRFAFSIHFAPFNDEKELFSGLKTYLQNHSFDLILAFSERSTAILCENAEELRKSTHIPYGTFNDFNILNDKFAILEICRQVNVPVPNFVSVEKPEHLKNAQSLGFPLVLKCRLASGVKEAFRICNSEEELEKAYQELTSSIASYSFFPCDRLVAEEYINGPIFDGGFSVKDGEVTSAITQERVWTIPPSGGFGAKNITRSIPEIFEYGKRIFNKIHWSGPAQLEFIYDQRTSQYKLIEINPRFWGTLGLAIKAGTNIAEDVISTGLGQRNNNVVMLAPEGVEFEWLLQEALTAEKMRGEGKNALIRQIKKGFSKEISNFSYSIATNLLLSIPHLLYYFSKASGKTKKNISLAKQLFG